MLCNNQRKDKLRNKWRIKGILAVKHIRPGPRSQSTFLFSLYPSLCALQCVCLSVCLSVSLCLFAGWQTVVPGRYKGATSLVASLRNQSRELCKYTKEQQTDEQQTTHTCMDVCVRGWYVCSVTDVCYRLKTCVTDNPARQKKQQGQLRVGMGN